MSVPAANQILNRKEIYNKLGLSDGINQSTVMPNGSDLTSIISSSGVRAWKAYSESNRLIRNDSLYKQWLFRYGSTLADAYNSSSFTYYTFVDTNWDSNLIYDLKGNSTCYLYNADKSTLASVGFYMMTGVSNVEYIYVNGNGVVTNNDLYTPPPSVSALVSNATSNTARLNGYISGVGITSWGFWYSTNSDMSNATGILEPTREIIGTNSWSFSSTININTGVDYYMQAFVQNPSGYYRSGIKIFNATIQSFYIVYVNPEQPLVEPGDLPRLGEHNKIIFYTDSSKSTYFTTTVEYVFKIYRNSNLIDTITIPAGYYQHSGTLENTSYDSTVEMLAKNATSLTKYSGTGNLSGYEITDFLTY